MPELITSFEVFWETYQHVLGCGREQAELIWNTAKVSSGESKNENPPRPYESAPLSIVDLRHDSGKVPTNGLGLGHYIGLVNQEIRNNAHRFNASAPFPCVFLHLPDDMEPLMQRALMHVYRRAGWLVQGACGITTWIKLEA